jgi:hypothetical protein
MQKTAPTLGMVVGVVFLTMLVGVGGTYLYQQRNASIDLSPKDWFSDAKGSYFKDPKAPQPSIPWLSAEDLKVLKDPKAANKAAYEKMAREVWEQHQAQQSQGSWVGQPQQPQVDWRKGLKK